MLKRFFIITAIAIFAVSAAVAQSQSNNDMTIEESYLQETIENMIIRESARADSLDQKLLALEYIGEAIDRGNTSADIHSALSYLAQEGTVSVARENGRVINNHPTVRRQAAKYLGQLGTEEAKTALVQIVKSEKEPMVTQEAIKSLGDIGINENNEVVLSIAHTFRRFDATNPDNLLALATIDTFEKLAKANGGLSPEAIQILIKISEGQYIKPVQERARQALGSLRKR